MRHEAVHSGAWLEALEKMVEIDSKRALKRRDLLKALLGYRLFAALENGG